MNIRSIIIERLRKAFETVRDNPPAASGKPVQIKSIIDGFTAPTDLRREDLPSVSIEYFRRSRQTQPDETQVEGTLLSMTIHAVVPELPNMNLLESASAMEETVRKIVRELNSPQIIGSDGRIAGVSVGSVRSGEGRFTAFEYLNIRIDFAGEYDFPGEEI